jgi:hypothetical protein
MKYMQAQAQTFRIQKTEADRVSNTKTTAPF